MKLVSKTLLGKEAGVDMYEWRFVSVFDGEPFFVIGPDPLGPIDPQAPAKWRNTVGTYRPKTEPQ